VGYTVSDQHVKEIGIWIDEIHYREPNDPPGRLRYKISSVLHDDDTFPDNYFRHKITILGLGPKDGVVQQRAVDLAPFSPLGTSPAAFCRMEQSGKMLRVTVKNKGTIGAGSSKTTVRFVEHRSPWTLPFRPVAPSTCYSKSRQTVSVLIAHSQSAWIPATRLAKRMKQITMRPVAA